MCQGFESSTFKNIRNATLKIDKGRIIVYTVVVSHRKILGFHECYSMFIAVIVDILQFLQDLCALFTPI